MIKERKEKLDEGGIDTSGIHTEEREKSGNEKFNVQSTIYRFCEVKKAELVDKREGGRTR